MATPDPRLLQAIRRQPAYLRVPLLTTALIESGGRLNASAAGPEDSEGPYQENILGRGAGLSIAQRRDPFASTQRAAREFQTFYNRGARDGDLAYRAQRPADRTGYLNRYSQYASEAQRILGGAGGPPPPATPRGRANPAPASTGPAGRRSSGAPTGGGGIPPDAAALVLRYAQDSEQDVLAGRDPRSIAPILPTLAAAMKKARPAPTATAPTAAPGPRAPRPGGGGQGGGGGAPLSGPVGGFTRGGGPEDHGRRALGNWQSDNAYDIMGRAGQPVYSPITGRVVKISGQPGGDPGFAGYGITVDTANGQLFFKHLGSTPLKVGSQIRPGGLIGTLDAKTAGGPHIHLGGQNRGFLDRLYARYVGGR